MSTQYVCQNCQELYKPPRRKNGICKTCTDSAVTAKEATKQKLNLATNIQQLKDQHVIAVESLKRQLAFDIAMLQEQAELDMVIASNDALHERYQPPSTNDYLRI